MNLVKRKNADFPSIFDELFQTDWFGGIANQVASTTNIPATNIKETADNFILEVAAPGKTKEDFKLALDHDVLTISTEAKKEVDTETSSAEAEKYTRKEFSFEAFKRSFKLPQTVNKEEIKATYTNGILNVALPKREEDKVKPQRTIEIS
ncbi:Spore protein SP21 [Kordia antarctica]|uniref:Spore protein SP21 n=1 Tax=Kordia antarctica TaxID=1218801 RepID=A0A7L4ZR22_9FLAO|nr:Hsp20/alpha crystallin family protein [Kordia antarctica]QHI38939.1 Spore protein SP21 [Kordia antarctica]